MTRIASRQHRSTHFRLSQAPWLLFAALAPLWPAQAAAQASCAELTCPVGYSCELAPGACPAIYCVGPDCPVCDPKPLAYCAAAACATNADCGEGMLCAEQVTTICEDSVAPAPSEPAPTTGAACAPDSSCGREQPAPNCTSQTTFWCTPRWQLPCDVDADCGAGFRCEEQMSCSVAPSLPTDPGDRPVNADPSGTPVPITCAPNGVSSCIAIERACNADADCASGWTCAENPNGTCSASSDGRTSCEPADPAKLCRPPYAGLPSGGGTPAIATDAIGDSAGAPAAAPVPRPAGLAESASSAPAVEGGCSLGTQRSTGSNLALFTLGLGAMFSALRRRTR